MKQIFTIIAVLVIFPTSVFSQIKVDRNVEENVKQSAVTLDSSVDFSEYEKAEQFLGLVGSKVYACHLNRGSFLSALRRISLKNKQKKFKVFGHKYRYGEFIPLRPELLSLYEKYIEDKYFQVDSVKFYDILGNLVYSPKLVRAGTVVLYMSNEDDEIRIKHSSIYSKCFLSVPYFEYIKNKYETKKFLNNEKYRYSLKSYYSSNAPADSYFRPNKILEEDIFTGTDVKLQKNKNPKSNSVSDFELKIYFENNKGKVISCGMSSLRENSVLSNLVSLSEYEKILAKYGARKTQEEIREEQKIREIKQQKEREIQKKKNIKEFGKYYGKLINENRVVIGMSAKMCRAAWGEPDHINRTVTKYSTSEQWVYDSGNYLYFENGKLTAIQN